MLLALLLGLAAADTPPYAVAPDVFDPAQPDLGLRPPPGIETATIYAPGETGDTWVPYAVSGDGLEWSKPRKLRGRGDLQPLRAEGTFKRPGYSYPKSTIWKGHLHVGYAANKEDAQVTRISLASFVEKPGTPRPRCEAAQ